MKKYIKPELKVENLDVNDIITVSLDVLKLLTWGSEVKSVDSDDVPQVERDVFR